MLTNKLLNSATSLFYEEPFPQRWHHAGEEHTPSDPAENFRILSRLSITPILSFRFVSGTFPRAVS